MIYDRLTTAMISALTWGICYMAMTAIADRIDIVSNRLNQHGPSILGYIVEA